MYFFPVAERVAGGVSSPNPTQRESKGANKGQRPIYFLPEAIPGSIYIKSYYRANNRGEYADGLYNSMIDDKDSHIPSPLIIYTCTALRHAPVEWQINKGVHPKASKLKLKVDIPDRSKYFNYKNDSDKNASCCRGHQHRSSAC